MPRPLTARRNALPAAVLAGACFAAFGRTVGHGFLIWDDRSFIAANPLIARPSAASLVALWTTPWRAGAEAEPLYGMYAPLTYTLWALLSALLGPRPWAFHLTNVTLHALNACAVFALLRQLLPRDDTSAALAGALLFAVHPVQTEAVAWATATNNLLSALFSLIAVRQYLLFREFAERRRYLGASAAFACALLAKPAAVSLPAVLVLLNRTVYRRDWAASLRGLAPWFVAAAAVTLLVARVQRAARYLHYIAPIWLRPAIAFDALTFYLGKLVLPLNLIPDYTRSSEALVSSGALAYTWIPAAGLLGTAWALRRRLPWLGAAVAVFVAALLPVVGLAPFAFQYYSNVADRYVYLAMLGPAIGLGLVYGRLPSPGRRIFVPLAIVTLLVLGFVQASYWKDDVTLYSRTIAVNPRSSMAHNDLGQILLEQGRLEDALLHYRAAATGSLDPMAMVNIGNVLNTLGRYDEAIGYYGDVFARMSYLEHTPAAAYMHNNLGVAYMRKNMYEAAAAEFERAISIVPGYLQPYVNLGSMLMSAGRRADAAEVFRRGLAVSPTDEVLRTQLEDNLGVVLALQGRLAEAEARFREAVRLQPHYAEAEFNLGNALARQGRASEAIPYLREAVRDDPRSPEAHAGLGTALLNMGSFQEAAVQLSEAVRLKPDFAVAHYNLARALELQGSAASASDHYQRALTLDPNLRAGAANR